jgi:hypothetical protein
MKDGNYRKQNKGKQSGISFIHSSVGKVSKLKVYFQMATERPLINLLYGF